MLNSSSPSPCTSPFWRTTYSTLKNGFNHQFFLDEDDVCGYSLIAGHWSSHKATASLLRRHSGDGRRHQAIQSSPMLRHAAPQIVVGPPLLRPCSRRRWADNLSTMPASKSITAISPRTTPNNYRRRPPLDVKRHAAASPAAASLGTASGIRLRRMSHPPLPLP
jgi:hypothetical protein